MRQYHCLKASCACLKPYLRRVEASLKRLEPSGTRPGAACGEISENRLLKCFSLDSGQAPNYFNLLVGLLISLRFLQNEGGSLCSALVT